jgi:hypothetical protein
MKSLSIRGVAVATLLFLLCTSFYSPKKAIPPAKPDKEVSSQFYYFYLADDSYDGYCTIDQEIARLEALYDVYVDNNSPGGTLLARGYTLYGLPHTVWPSVFLYGHF